MNIHDKYEPLESVVINNNSGLYVVIAILIIVIISIVVGFAFFYYHRKQKMKREMEEELVVKYMANSFASKLKGVQDSYKTFDGFSWRKDAFE